jgi:hypothetical protein
MRASCSCFSGQSSMMTEGLAHPRDSSRAACTPYDNDAVEQLDGWIAELQAGGHVRLYEVDGSTYLDVPKWLEHQKIDHPAKSRLPEFREGLAKVSEAFARTGETFAPHTLDLGPRTNDSVPNGTGGQPPGESLTALIFGSGLSWLRQNSGKSEDACRALLGKWRKELGDEVLLTALGRAQRECTLQPVAWMEAGD